MKKKQSAHDRYIQVLNAEIDKLQAENKALRNEIALLNQNIASYKDMLVRIEDLKNLYQQEIQKIAALKEAYQNAIDDAKAAERQYTAEFKALMGRIKQ